MIHFNKEIIHFKNTRYLFEEENRERERELHFIKLSRVYNPRV